LGGIQTSQNPIDHRESKCYVLIDAGVIPLDVMVIGTHCSDVTQLLPLIQAVAVVINKIGILRRHRKRL
jgi:hypothetical protein